MRQLPSGVHAVKPALEISMRRFPVLLPWILIALLGMMAAACSPQPGVVATTPSNPPPGLTAAAGTFTDPFAYCKAAGTTDKPDSRYTGAPIPDQIISGFKKAAGLEGSTEPMDVLRQSTIWRCMGGKVYACNFGANLPCDSKGNSNKTPTPPMEDYCRANPNSDFIPMSATGHDTIYSWHCINDKAQLLEQTGQLDAQGYLAQIWYPIEPSP